MKKLLIIPAVIAIVIACNSPKDPQNVPVSLADTTKVIDTTIIEDGVAPIADNTLAKGKPDKQKKEKVSCAFGFQKFNNRKRPKEEAPGGIKGKPNKFDTQVPTLNGDPIISNVKATGMTISWPPASDNKTVTGYDLFRDGIKIISTNSTSFTDAGLTPTTTYTYYYRARDAAGNLSASSASVTGTTLDSGGDPPTGSKNVIYLNFWGKTVSGTMWNAGSFTVGEAGLVGTEIDFVIAQVLQHYIGYDVAITSDKSVFDAAEYGHKVEIIITEDYQWYGQAGGVAYINSFFWTDGSPAFVFSLLLNYNGHNIAEAIAHEAGHTLGLRHQSDCVNGVITNQYSNGKTMGVSYYVPLGIWVIGTSSLSCQEQNDMAMLQSAVGLKQVAYLRPRSKHQSIF